MENQYALMMAGFLNALTPTNLIVMLLSVTMGIIIGCMPGLSAAMGVALLLPLTFGMEPSSGLIMLGGIYCGAIFGGSISAILIHTPGTPASAATAIDGYAMTLKGKAGKALGTACTASFFGGLLSCLSLYFFAPILAELAMKFGSPEYFWLSLFGLTIIAGINSDSMILGLMSGAFGLVLSTIGMDPMEGVERFMFDQDALYNGVNITGALFCAAGSSATSSGSFPAPGLPLPASWAIMKPNVFQSIQKSLVMAPLKGLPVLRRPIMLLRAVPSSLPSLWASLARALQLSSWAGSSFKGFSPDLSSLQSMQT